MAGKLRMEIQFSTGSASKVSAREIQRSGEAAKPAADAHGALAELVARPTRKKFKEFLSDARKSPKEGRERTNEIRQVLEALNAFVEIRQPGYDLIGEIVDNVFFVYEHEIVARIASSLAYTDTPIDGERLLFFMCVCSKDEAAAKNAFSELKGVFASRGNSKSGESFEDVARIVEEEALSEGASKMARDSLSRSYASWHRVSVN